MFGKYNICIYASHADMFVYRNGHKDFMASANENLNYVKAGSGRLLLPSNN